jgi:hypothetical protein
MDDFKVTIINTLLALATAAIPALVAGFWKWLSGQSAKIDNELLQGITARSIAQADAVTGAAFGRIDALMKAAQHPDSPGGSKITSAEWNAILGSLFQDFKAGFGDEWLSRAGKVIGLVPFEASAKAQIEASLVKKIDEKRAANAQSSAHIAAAAKVE